MIVRSSSFPHGQGHDTIYAQIVADRLGIPIEDVELRFGDSAEAPAGVGTFGGRSIPMAGSAVAVAADRLAAGERSASVRFESAMVFGSGAYAAIVSVDEETGELTVHRIAAVDDAGTIINPLLAEGQVLGGTIHGLGTVLTEEFALRRGRPAARGELHQLRDAQRRRAAAGRDGVRRVAVALEPARREGDRRGGHDRDAGRGRQRGDRALGGRWVDPPFTPEKLWRAIQASR